MQDYVAFPDQRQNVILKRLDENGAVNCSALSLEMNVSEHTIRRDLKELAQKGLCKKVHGGAVKTIAKGGNFEARVTEVNSEKRAVSSKVASLVRRNSCLFLDSGSTNLEIARSLPPDFSLTVVTNSPLIATEAEKISGCEVVLIGGKLNSEVGGCLGISALNQLTTFHFDQTILGVCAFDITQGLTAFIYDDAEFKREVVKRSNEIIIPLNPEKASGVAKYSVASSDEISTLVISGAIPEELQDRWVKSGLNVILSA